MASAVEPMFTAAGFAYRSGSCIEELRVFVKVIA
jgi:hypothetical protein